MAMLRALNWSGRGTCQNVWAGLVLFVVLSAWETRGQSLIMSDDFEVPGTAINTSIWPYTAGTRVEANQTFFGASNHYLSIGGGGVKALSANWTTALDGQTSTFAFDFYEPSSSGDGVIIGYAAGTSDINTAGAFARIQVGGGVIGFAGTDGTVLTNSATLSYPRDTRLTFSLALNHSATNRAFNGSTLAAKTLEVWYYDWAGQQSVYVLSIDVSASIRTPVCVGFRTWSASTNAQAYVDNVKLVDAPVVVTPGFVPAEPSLTPVIPTRPFVHPCILNSQQDLERIKYRVNYEPGSAAALGWSRLRSSSYASLTYAHVPYSNVVVVASGTTNSETQFRNDGQAAWAHALQWVITGDSRYRDKAMTIMNDWANTFVMLSPAPGTSSAQLQLEAAWYAPVWVAAADILRYYNQGAAGWPSTNIAKFDVMLDYLYGKAAQSATRNNNWGASAALAMIAVGAYQENRSRFDAGVQAWRDNLVSVNAAVGNNGYINEVCRDTTHPQYTLQVWMQAAEIAWKQGIDLYGTTFAGSTVPQFVINLENFADLFLGLALPPCDATFQTNYNYVGDQSQSGAYDIAYNHYVLRAGSTNLPHYSDMVLNHWRPGGVDAHFNPWSTLTHGELSAGIPAVSAIGLWNPASNAFATILVEGDTVNLRGLGGLRLGAQTTGTVSSVLYSTNGTPMGSAATNAPFLSGGWPLPGNHLLQAVPSQNRTGGSIPGDPFTRFIRVVDLPTGWEVHDLGQPGVPAWGSETGGIFTFNSAGTNVAGASDQCGLVSALIAGDLQLTARLTSLAPSGSAVQAGLMVRESLSAGARQVFLSLAPTGTNRARFCLRTNQSDTATAANAAAPPGPVWLRMVRLGNVFSGYYSADGNIWVAFGSAIVPMNTAVQAGLAGVSGSPNSTALASFDKVLIEPLSAPFGEWQQWMFAMRGVTNALLIAAEADPDSDGRSNWMEYQLGSDPLVADAKPAFTVTGFVNGSSIALRCTERKNADDLGRKFYFSGNLAGWTAVTPISSTQLEDRGSVVVREVVLPAPAATGFYRAGYSP